MRTKKAFYNTTTGIIYQLCSIVCGFIIPRLILGYFGSEYNGMISSITQFLGWISILTAGVGGVTRAALYKPLNKNDNYKISGIINATDNFMKKIALIFLGGLIIFAIGYPFLLKNKFEWFFVFTMVLVLGINTFAQYFFGMTYQNLLEADQRQYIYSTVRILTTLISTLVTVVLIIMHFDIRIVKLASSLIFAVNPIFLNIYVKKYYSIDTKIAPDNSAISQRWHAFAQEIAVMINNNTDIVVLTIFSNVLEISVYVIYNMVLSGVKQLLQTFTTGIGAAFGSMIAEGIDNSSLNRKLKVFEVLVYNITTILFSVTLVTIVPFVRVYTSNINDVNYIRPVFAIIITIAAMFNCFRIPYQTIVYAAGHFKQTRNGSIVEVILNLSISIILVIKIGLIGVAIGTLVGSIFRTLQYGIYLSRNIIVRSNWLFYTKIVISLLETMIIYII
ncbi:TPA: lipopolysaccharide biosynthesis protein, partial [Enterococcus faecium]